MAQILRALKAEKLRRLRETEAQREAEHARANEAALRRQCDTLYGFIQVFWRVLEPTAEFRAGWAIRAMCDHLEAVHYGYIQNLLINVPPGMMKSLLVSVFFQAWEWGPKGRPDLRYLATSYSEANVLRDSNKVRKLIESPLYQALWGDTVQKSAKWGERKFENTAGGNRDCRPFSALTGGRGDRVLIDDPHSTESAESDAERNATIRMFREGATDRLNDISRSATIVIMQRLHENDVAGTILKLDPTFVHLNLPMEFEPDRRCVTVLRPANDGNPAILFEDPRTTDGELLFPERFPPAAIDRLKKLKGSFAWAGQYQQRPAPREGGLFKRRWFEVVGAVPAGAQRVRKWDLAASTEATSADPDWTVGLLMARDTAGFIYIEHVERFRGTPAEVETAIKNTASLDAARYGVVRIGLNQDPGQAGKAQVSYLTRQLLGYTVETERETGPKEVRAAPLAAQAEAGNVKIVEGDWNEAFLGEMETFPSGGHDDQVDAASGAFAMLAGASIATWAALAS